MEQVNEVINNVTALVGTVLPQKESADALKKVASTTSEKMSKAQTRADDDDASINTEYLRSNERSIKTEYLSSNERTVRPMSRISSKSSKSVRDIIVDVSRSFSHVSQISSESSKSVEEAVVEVPVARSRSNISTKSSSASKNSSISVAEVPVVARSRSHASTKSAVSKNLYKSDEEEVAEVPVSRSQSSVSIRTVVASKTPAKSAEQMAEVEENYVVGKACESHIVVSYGSAEEKIVSKNTQRKRWWDNDIALAAAYIFCALAFTVAIFFGTGGLGSSRIQSSQGKIFTNDPTYYPTYMPTYMPTYTYEPTLDAEIATGKGSGKKKEKERTETRGPHTKPHPNRDPV